MTALWPDPPQVPSAPRTFPAAQTLTVADPLCGHIGDEPHNTECAYWRGVASGEYPHPDTYVVTGGTQAIVLPRHLPGLEPLTDPALRGAA